MGMTLVNTRIHTLHAFSSLQEKKSAIVQQTIGITDNAATCINVHTIDHRIHYSCRPLVGNGPRF